MEDRYPFDDGHGQTDYPNPDTRCVPELTCSFILCM